MSRVPLRQSRRHGDLGPTFIAALALISSLGCASGRGASPGPLECVSGEVRSSKELNLPPIEDLSDGREVDTRVLCVPAHLKGVAESTGRVIEVDRTGKPVSQGFVENGERSGEWRFWSEDESLGGVVTFVKGKQHGHRTTWTYDDEGNAVGRTMWSLDGGVEHGPSISVAESGRPKVMLPMVDGRIQGLGHVWRADGTLESAMTYVDDDISGKLERYFPSGELRSIWKGTRYPDGEIQFFYRDGSDRGAGSVRSGVKAGNWTYRNHKGQISKIERYSNGELSSIEIYQSGAEGPREVRCTDESPLQKGAVRPGIETTAIWCERRSGEDGSRHEFYSEWDLDADLMSIDMVGSK